MNKNIFWIVVVFLLFAGCKEIPNPETARPEKPGVSYEIEAWGSNPNILEFTPKHNPDYFCVLAISGGWDLKSIFCMPKAGREG